VVFALHPFEAVLVARAAVALPSGVSVASRSTMARRQLFTISVGRRIAFLIIAEALMMGVLVGYLSRSLSSLAADLEYSRRFVIAPTEALADTMERAVVMEAELDSLHRSGVAPSVTQMAEDLELFESFARRYRADWMVVDNPGEDARRFREELDATGQVGLLDDERSSFAQLEAALPRLRARIARAQTPDVVADEVEATEEVRRAVRSLISANVRFVAVDHQIHAARARDARVQLIGLGLGVFVLTLLLGLHIRRAIGPRIAAMASKVRTFQETGEYTRTAAAGADEIAVLSNALDAGFSAIRERDRERERFLAVVAHELKTPLTSIAGFADAALVSADDAVRTRALAVVHRQTSRLNRLVQDLLLAASARGGALAFRPTPVDARALVTRVTGEVEDIRHRFEVVAGGESFLLADEELLGHALWQVLSYAAAIADKSSMVRVHVERTDARAVIDVEIPKPTLSSDDIERAFLPFASVQYEGGGLRYAVGLYLSREIASLHGGTLSHVRGRDGAATLRMELPA
jgi:signal transduction histidine kinase